MKSSPAILLLALLAGATRLEAGTMDSLRANLERLSGTTPVEGTLDLRVLGEQEDRPDEDGHTTVRVIADASGLTIHHSAAELEKVEREARDLNPDRNRPSSRAVRSIDATEVSAMLDYAPHLLQTLDGARVTNESAVKMDGRDLTLLELELVVRLSESAKKRVKSARSTMKLWLDERGYPVASERSSEVSGRILVIRFEGSEKSSRRFTVSGDRLVVTSSETENRGSGLGQSAGEKRWATLRIGSSR